MKENKDKKSNASKSQSIKKKRASFKVKKVYSRKPKLSEINMLDIIVVIVPRDKDLVVCDFAVDRGAIVLSKSRGKGVSRSSIFSGVGANETPVTVIFLAARSEESASIITQISENFRLDIPGNGKSFMINALGYMGAKAPFIEKKTRR